MKCFNKKLLYTGILLAVVFAGCKKDFLDVNTDPNRATDASITPELLFTQAAVSVGDQAVGGTASDQGAKLPTQFMQNWVGYMAPNGDFAVDQTEVTYNIDFGFGNTLWADNYNTLFDLYLVKTKALSQGGDTVMAGAAMILSAKIFQEMVDLFGDIPYSQAFQENTFPTPAYDKAQDIYNALQLSLDTAIMYMGHDAPSSFTDVDIINGGDQDLWIKFANTLKLRLLIRQSEVPGFDPSAEIAKITAHGGVLGAGESVSVNPGYLNDVAKQSPFYANYGFTPTGNKASTSENANAYIIDILSSTDDPRISRFFTDVDNNYVGNEYGVPQSDLSSGANTSYFGPGLIGSPTQDQWIYPSFESMFLQAEAIARGWMTGDAKAAYEAAVTESFTWLGVPDAAAAAKTYMTDNAIANWSKAGSTPGEKAKFIVFQKYIALCGIDPREAYADQRRLHFLPNNNFISQNPGRISNTLPLRLLYPQDEYTTNSVSVSKVGTIDAFSTKLFWEP